VLDARSRPARILLVEDEALVRMLAIEYLEEAGYRVEPAVSAMDAMNKVRLLQGDIDGAIVDVGLPDRKGDALVSELRALFQGCPSSLRAATRRHLSERDFAAMVELHFSTNPIRKSNCWRSSTRSARNSTYPPLILSTVLPVMFCARDVLALLRVGLPHPCEYGT